jgi:thioredoxin 1
MRTPYLAESETPSREEVDGLRGPVLLEFGTDWCGHCRALEPEIARQLAASAGIRHVKVEDGPGRPLGRSFHVRLWPSLVFMRDGAVVRQLARPSHQDLRDAFAAIASEEPASTR